MLVALSLVVAISGQPDQQWELREGGLIWQHGQRIMSEHGSGGIYDTAEACRRKAKELRIPPRCVPFISRDY